MSFYTSFMFVILLQTTTNSVDSQNADKTGVPAMELYRKLFQQKRTQQRSALEGINSLNDYTKQYKMINIIFEQLFKVVTDAKLKLTESGFLPGDSFPDNQTTREYLSIITENTAFFGDIALRFPDITHKIYDKKQNWQLTLKWNVGVCNDSKIFEGPDQSLLNLMAQELNIIPKEANYINPYKIDNGKELGEKQMKHISVNEKSKKKQKKAKKRGPVMSRVDL